MIDKVLDNLIDGVNKQINHLSTYVKKLLDVMEIGVTYTTHELMKLLNMKSRTSFRNNYLNPSLDNGLIKMTLPNKQLAKIKCIIKINHNKR